MSISPWKPGGCLLVPGLVIIAYFGAVFIGMGILWVVDLIRILPEAWR